MWDEAFTTFSRAEQQAHSPVFGLYMARCKRQMGALIAARSLYREVAAEKLPADAPAPWLHAVITAKAELRATEQQIPSICVRADRSSNVVRITLSGRDFSVSERCREVELDPGEHTVVLWDGSGRRRPKTIVVEQGQRRLALPLEPKIEPVVEQPQNATLASTHVVDMPSASPRWQKTLGFVALGVGAVGLGLGTVAGIVAAQKKAELGCPEDRCPRSEAPKIRSVTRWANVSTVGFIFGAASAATGVTIFVLVSQDQPKALELAASGSF